MKKIDINKINKQLQDKTPFEIVKWAIDFAERPVVTTNFRPYEASILHVVSSVTPSIKVIWCDTGYNTPNTYKHAEKLICQLNLNVKLYVPKQTAEHRNVYLGIPQIDDPKHKIFSEEVKLEPFKRAMSEHQPDVWFTNLRKGQTAFRDNLDIVSQGNDGIIKVSPFYNWTDSELDDFLKQNNLPNEFKYFDPTKQLGNRECGIHTQN
ncbi:MAG: phosphoadenosine phosphosulfate reductase family protein [Crocinitomicaceae bacterium]|nr:phosphoadenosine phosphosulfate reductase family protein [Crocinitomicaceae bacterium]